MRPYFAKLCPWLLPLAGTCLLLMGLASHGLETRLNKASATEDVQPRPARFNPTRRVQLRQAYRCYRRQRARLLQARTPPELAACRAAVSEAAANYTQVAADTDPSAFNETTLPRQLSASSFQ